jgi:hypothetical protein
MSASSARRFGGNHPRGKHLVSQHHIRLDVMTKAESAPERMAVEEAPAPDGITRPPATLSGARRDRCAQTVVTVTWLAPPEKRIS